LLIVTNKFISLDKNYISVSSVLKVLFSDNCTVGLFYKPLQFLHIKCIIQPEVVLSHSRTLKI
jgi:hypothetical protein